ncbi:hypothetical protein [Campylobacter troglodytis]|uniref:hypothetical protein n=1 Tax=Campylobacter troglodytis TaxID=654363 RepID=UPI00115847DC|nr:hypothetical protein [Campylobacter troglodytis]
MIPLSSLQPPARSHCPAELFVCGQRFYSTNFAFFDFGCTKTKKISHYTKTPARIVCKTAFTVNFLCRFLKPMNFHAKIQRKFTKKIHTLSKTSRKISQIYVFKAFKNSLASFKLLTA